MKQTLTEGDLLSFALEAENKLPDHSLAMNGSVQAGVVYTLGLAYSVVHCVTFRIILHLRESCLPSIVGFCSVLFLHTAKHQLYIYVDDCSWFGLMDYREPTLRELVGKECIL